MQTPVLSLLTTLMALTMGLRATAVHLTLQGRGNNCSDVAPDQYCTCAEHKGFGNCNHPEMLTPTRHLPEAFCQSTCGRCPYLPAASTITQHHSTVHHDLPVQATNSTFIYTSQLAASRSLLASCSCTDTQPDSTYTCAQQKAFGKCSTAFVGGKGFCQTTCGRCQCNPSCSCDDVQPAGAYTCAQQKAFGKCSDSFMKAGSHYPPVAPNGYCRITCGSCNCDTAQSTGSAPSTPTSTSQTPRSPPAAQARTSLTSNPRTSPVSSSVRRPSPASTTRGPPAPLSAAYLARCQCTDAPPPDASSCADVLGAGRCNVYETIVGNKQHPEGFCQSTCNRCNNYCVPKTGGAAPTTPASSSSTPNSSGCSDNPPDNKYTCAQQKSFGKCGQSFMTQGKYCLKTCGQCFIG